MDADEIARQQAAAMAAIHRQNQAGAAAKAMLANTNATASSQAAAANGHQNTRGRGESKDTRWQRDGGILGAIGLNAIFSDPNKDKFKREHKASVDAKRDPKADAMEAAAAADEHSWGTVSLWSSPEQLLEQGLGKGVMWYFKFGRFMVLYNTLLVCVASISWFTSLGVGPRFEETNFLFPGTFYISTYASSTYPAYVICVTLMLICCFALGPAYRYYVLWYEELQVELRNKAAAGGGDVNWVEDEYEGQYGNEHFEFVNEEAIDKIEYDFQMKTRYSPLGVLLSATLMLVILGVSGIITFYLQRASRQVGGNALASFFIAAFIAIIGFTWEYLCNILTKLEYWAYWSDYFKSTCVKVLLFKILNIFTVFLVKRIEFQADEDNVCQLEELATQFFILLGFNTSATIANMIFVACFTDQNEERSPDGWREFILSQEYVELVYRQFLVHLGFLLAPMMALFAVMATILEYGCDKYRLLRICHKPKATKSSFRGVLAFYFFLSALFVMFSFPNGAVFVLAGSFGLADSDTCFIYQ